MCVVEHKLPVDLDERVFGLHPRTLCHRLWLDRVDACAVLALLRVHHHAQRLPRRPLKAHGAGPQQPLLGTGLGPTPVVIRPHRTTGPMGRQRGMGKRREWGWTAPPLVCGMQRRALLRRIFVKVGDKSVLIHRVLRGTAHHLGGHCLGYGRGTR